jgi:hypothetical protein
MNMNMNMNMKGVLKLGGSEGISHLGLVPAPAPVLNS